MGKAADNEKHKLDATYNNNVAVGLTIAGYWVPTTAAVLNSYPLVHKYYDGGLVSFSQSERFFAVAIIVVSLVSLASAYSFRRRAMAQAELIED